MQLAWYPSDASNKKREGGEGDMCGDNVGKGGGGVHTSAFDNVVNLVRGTAHWL